MFDVGQYLAAIGYRGSLDPSLRTLRGLQECHVRAVPYHSRPDDIAFLTGAEFDVDQAFQHSIVGRAGGSCYELNEPFRQLLDGIVAEVRRLDGTAASILGDQELMRAALPSLRADYTAAETYRCPPEVTISCPVTVLTGDADPQTTSSEARAWERHTSGACEVRTYSGGHFFVTTRANEIMALLRHHFAASESGPPVLDRYP
jgi:arylamine N-acetyltransferase